MIKEIKILLSTKEPDRNHLWLRPRLNTKGFDLLYFSSEGWVPLIDFNTTEFLGNTSCEEDDPNK